MRDALISPGGARQSANYYGADFLLVEDEGHNLMMEKIHAATALKIDGWLTKDI